MPPVAHVPCLSLRTRTRADAPIVIQNNPTNKASQVPSGGLGRVTSAVAAEEDARTEERSEDLALIAKIEDLPRDVGWLLICAGALGVILPGVIGFPFVIAGTAVVTAPRPMRLTRWIGRNPPKLLQRGLRQISRMLDDLERRYPSVANKAT
jgi:hypothetical protein